MPDPPLLTVYRDEVGPLFRWVARRVGGDRELAEDVVQEVWLRTLRSWRRGVPRDARAWLTTVAANLLRNHFRRVRPASSVVVLDLAREDFAPDTPDAAALLHWGLARLRAGQARLVEAHHLEGESLAQLADRLGLSERAVEGRLHRARNLLKRHLAPHVGRLEMP
ncbi:MAG: sigma-70 family RNA polymerase sigma factor [Planctomycetota bacterium]|nr:sigma-70 family RNA polymerase sigma factor [Planctomycetota bacterium]